MELQPNMDDLAWTIHSFLPLRPISFRTCVPETAAQNSLACSSTVEEAKKNRDRHTDKPKDVVQH
jgi:hypothetical protein